MKTFLKALTILPFVVLITVSAFLILGNGKSFSGIRYSNRDATKTQMSGELIREGKEVFHRYCIACHGADGKADGVEAYRLETKPTDFTSGNIEFKSTPYRTLPVENDIVTTLRLGVRTTAMLPQLQLSDAEMHAVAAYVMSLMPGYLEKGIPIEIVKAPTMDGTLLRTGKKLFVASCAPCHGTDARGDGPASKTLFDYRNKAIHPADLTLRPLKRANTPERMYMIITTGLEGTPMPAFQQALKPNQRWAIVDYVESLKRGFVASRSGGMMGGMMNVMMRGMMKHRLVGEEYKGMMIDMDAARAWMMGSMMNGH